MKGEGRGRRTVGEAVGAAPEMRRLGLADLQRFKEAFAAADKRVWCYYFPFLLCYSRSPSRSILWMQERGSLAVFLARGAQRPRLDVLFPPIPMQGEALRACVDIVNEWNGDRSGRILWVDKADAAAIWRAGGWAVRLKEEEYVYSPGELSGLGGGRWRTVRRNVERVARLPGLQIRDYRADDAETCRQLLARWEVTQGRRHTRVLDRGYTLACLELAPCLRVPNLVGEVILVDGKVVGFAFGGEMRRGMASFFIAKADTSVRGLSYFQRWHFLERLREYEEVNDASDLGHPGLAQFKKSLRPVGMVAVFSAEQTTRPAGAST